MTKDRLGVFKQLRTMGFWRELPARGRSGVLLIPSIPVAGGIRPLFGAGEPLGPPRVFPETLVADRGLLWCENLGLIGDLTNKCATKRRTLDIAVFPTQPRFRRGRNGPSKLVSTDRT